MRWSRPVWIGAWLWALGCGPAEQASEPFERADGGDRDSGGAADAADTDAWIEGDAGGADRATVDAAGVDAAQVDSADIRCEQHTDCPSSERCDLASARCVARLWRRLDIEIDDPVVNGSSLMTPVDSFSFGYDAQAGDMVTEFSRSYDDPSQTSLWHLDVQTGRHYQVPLQGQVFAADANLCSDTDWCQLIGYDPVKAEWVVAGPVADHLMRVDAAHQASLTAVSGEQPGNSWISYRHLYAWETRHLYLHGWMAPWNSSTSVYGLDLDTATWSVVASDLPEVSENCLAYDSARGLLYSVAGSAPVAEDEELAARGLWVSVDVAAGTHSSVALPAALAGRSLVHCAYDSRRDRVYLFGGAEQHDYYDDTANTYFNDLWSLDPASGQWSQLDPGYPGGELVEDDYHDTPVFVGDPYGPNFGRHQGVMRYDASGDRLMLMGEVPIFTHGQLFFLDLPLS